MQLHLHMGLTILLSLDLYVYFFATKLSPLLEKKNEMAIWDFSWTPNGLFFSMIQAQPHGSPQKKRAAFLFHFSCTLGHCYFLCVFLHVLFWCLMEFFFKLSIMLLTLRWLEDREFCACFRRGTVLSLSSTSLNVQVCSCSFGILHYSHRLLPLPDLSVKPVAVTATYSFPNK